MFSDLDFDSRRHLYFVNGENYPSVSSIVESFSPKFDENKMLPLSAKKQSKIRGVDVSVDQLRKEWKLTNEQACALGTNTHTFMEKYTGIETPATPQEIAGVKFIRDMTPEWNIIIRELRGYSRRFKFAGTQDVPLQHKITQKVAIADYKTNGDLFKAYDYLLPPFQYLESSPFNKYQIQLSLYDIILEEIGIQVSERFLVYLKSNAEYAIFKLQDLKDELKNWFNTKTETNFKDKEFKETASW